MLAPPEGLAALLTGLLDPPLNAVQIGTFENNPTPNQSRFSICGTRRLHYFAGVFNDGTC